MELRAYVNTEENYLSILFLFILHGVPVARGLCCMQV